MNVSPHIFPWEPRARGEMHNVVYAEASDQVAGSGCRQFPLSPLPSSQVSFFSSEASLVGAEVSRRQPVTGAGGVGGQRGFS